MRSRRGAALAVVLVALVVVAALGAGAALAARESNRSASDDLARVRAESRAWGSLEHAVREWDRRRNVLAVGAVDSGAGAADPRDVVRVVRLDRTRFLVEASARERSAAPGAAGQAERTASSLVRLAPPTVAALAAITSGGTLSVFDHAAVDGRDVPPPGWTDCATPTSDTAAVATAAAGAVHPAPQSTIGGALKQHSAAADTASYAAFGADDWTTLAARADVVVGSGPSVPTPRASASTCALAVDAWSEPMRGGGAVDACTTTFPIVVAPNGLALDGGRGQGMLLVNGDLVLNGSVTYAGVIVVRGALRADVGALRLHGALLVQGGGALGAGSLVQFSRCAIERAMDGIARASAARRHSWAEVTR